MPIGGGYKEFSQGGPGQNRGFSVLTTYIYFFLEYIYKFWGDSTMIGGDSTMFWGDSTMIWGRFSEKGAQVFWGDSTMIRGDSTMFGGDSTIFSGRISEKGALCFFLGGVAPKLALVALWWPFAGVGVLCRLQEDLYGGNGIWPFGPRGPRIFLVRGAFCWRGGGCVAASKHAEAGLLACTGSPRAQW